VPVKECLWLVKNGIPFDVAFGLDDVTRTAWGIAFSEMEGARFDWTRWEFVKDDR
jgi:hypothetical protein